MYVIFMDFIFPIHIYLIPCAGHVTVYYAQY